MLPRRTAENLVLLAMLVWTAYCLFFLLLLGVPAIHGAAEAAESTRLTIFVGWLAGIAVGAIAILGRRRSSFDGTPRRSRVRVAVAGYVLSALLVVSLYWLGLSLTLLFLWGPLVGGVLLLTAWASTVQLRARLRRALVGWSICFAVIAALWFVLPPGTLSFHFWPLLALVSLAAATWWVWPILLARAPRDALRS